ncbi:MAG: ribosomal protein L7/L12 [Phycisphaerales bacterium]|nr:ribosomal protein L7/L12 [Phycisphaerales bacterium]
MSKFEIKIDSVPKRNVAWLKALRHSTGCGLKEAANLHEFLADHAPCVFATGVDGEVAEHLCALLSKAGAAVCANETTVASPMLLHPGINRRYTWHWLWGRSARS